MDPALTVLLSWQFMLFSLGCFFVIWVIRTILEFFIPTISANKYWDKLALPLLPVFLGATVAHFITSYPYPNGEVATLPRELFGITAGGLSTVAFQVIKGLLKQQLTTLIVQTTTTQVPSATSTILEPPPPPPPALPTNPTAGSSIPQ